MKTTAKKRVTLAPVSAPAPVKATPAKKLTPPTLIDRVDAICKEAEDAIDIHCEQKRPRSVPVAVIKQMIMNRGGGQWCACEAYRRLIKNGGV